MRGGGGYSKVSIYMHKMPPRCSNGNWSLKNGMRLSFGLYHCGCQINEFYTVLFRPLLQYLFIGFGAPPDRPGKKPGETDSEK